MSDSTAKMPRVRVHPWALATLVLVALVAARGCANDEPFVAASEEDDAGAVCAYHGDCAQFCRLGLQGMAPYCTRACSSDTACAAGYVCVSDGQMGPVCAMGECSADDQCPAGYHCDADRQICLHLDISCGVDSDCPAATACNQGVCELVCQSDDDCKQGSLCHHDTRCVECVNNADCAADFACTDGHCNAACIEENDCRVGFACLDAGCQQIVGGGPAQLGESCNEHSECVDFCEYNVCGLICDPADPQSCPEGWSCHDNHMTCRQQG